MECAFYLVDSSEDSASRDSERFKWITHLVLNSEIREFYLVSKRPGAVERPFLESIPEKRFDKKGFLSKMMPERLLTRHLQIDQLDPSLLLERIGQMSHRDSFVYFEEDKNDLAFDGSALITKFLNVARERHGSVVGMKKIAFSDIQHSDLIKGNLVAEGEYRIHSLFRADQALHSSSNLALAKRMYLKPSFFKVLSQNIKNSRERALIESLDMLAKSELLFGALPFQPLRIK